MRNSEHTSTVSDVDGRAFPADPRVNTLEIRLDLIVPLALLVVATRWVAAMFTGTGTMPTDTPVTVIVRGLSLWADWRASPAVETIAQVYSVMRLVTFG